MKIMEGVPIKILLVEDDFGSRKLMQKLLAPFGDCDIAVDGEEAIDAFKIAWEEKTPYEVIFLDIMMPRLDGQQALQQLRKVEKEMRIPEADEVKVIMTTVLEDSKNVMKAFRDGRAVAYLVKPINSDKLLGEMKKLKLIQ